MIIQALKSIAYTHIRINIHVLIIHKKNYVHRIFLDENLCLAYARIINLLSWVSPKTKIQECSPDAIEQYAK